MTSPLIEAIKKDREDGTPGPWLYRPNDFDDWGVVRAGDFMICQARDPARMEDAALAAYRSFPKADPWGENARRIARVPDLEAALIAAEELADALDAWLRNRSEENRADLAFAMVAYRKATGGDQ